MGKKDRRGKVTGEIRQKGRLTETRTRHEQSVSSAGYFQDQGTPMMGG